MKRFEVKYLGDPQMQLLPNQSGEWRLHVRILHHKDDDDADILQVKVHDVTRPLFALAMKKGQLVVYRCDGIWPRLVQLFPLEDVLHKWILVTVRVDHRAKSVTYSVNGKAGQYSYRAVPPRTARMVLLN